MCRIVLTLENLRDGIQDTNYEKWNTTSIQTVFCTLIEYPEGTEERDIALKLLRGFIDWRKEQPAEYLPKGGLEFMYSNEYLLETYEYILSHPPPSENESLKKHNDFKKGVQEYYEQLRKKYPTRIATIQDIRQNQNAHTNHKELQLPFMQGFAFIVGAALCIAGYVVLKG